MSYPCAYGLSASGSCCDVPLASFPYEPSLLGTCLREMSQARGGDMPYGRVLYDTATGEIATVSMWFPTRHPYSEVYATASAYWREMQTWADAYLATAPDDMANGFGTLNGQLFFYSLQTGCAQPLLSNASLLI